MSSTGPPSTRTVLYAEDDHAARLLAREAFREAGFEEDLRFVEDGQELLDYLNRHGRYLDPVDAPTPSLVLLDLRLPRKDGREVLAEIRADPRHGRLPVVVLTTSNDEKEIASLYDLGATSFITKPPSFAAFIEVARAIRRLLGQPVNASDRKRRERS